MRHNVQEKRPSAIGHQQGSPKRPKFAAQSDGAILVLHEKWDADKLSQLINAATRSGPSFDAGTLAKMRRIHGDLNDAGELEVAYRHSTWVTEDGHRFGRIYGNGYQCVPGAVRRICGEKFYFDFDQVNAHPVLAKHLCHKYNISCPHLSAYVNNRETSLKKMNSNRQKAKTSYLCVLYDPSEVAEGSPLYPLSKEYIALTDTLWVQDEYQTIRDACTLHTAEHNARHPNDRKKVKSSFLAHVLGDHESRITRDNISYLQQQKINVGTNSHDGMLVEKTSIVDPDAVCRALEKNTKEMHGITVQYVQKSTTPTNEDEVNLWHPFNDYRQNNTYDYNRVVSKLDRVVSELNADLSLDGKQRITKVSRCICQLFNMVFARVAGVKPLVHQREVVGGVVRYKERSQDDFLKLHGKDTVNVLCNQDPNKGDMFKRLSPAKIWVESRSKLKYARVVFNATPHGEPEAASPDELNLFQGLKVVPTKKFTEEEMRDIGPFLDHVLNGLCRGDNAVFDYVIRWLAVTVLKPWQKLRQCVVLQGEPGSGKGTLVEVIKQCIGERYVTSPPTLEEALEGFNASYVDTCLLMFLDEAFFGGCKKTNGGLKKLITERHVASREKFRENRSIDNKFNIIMASNENHVLQSHKNSRRGVVLECSGAMAGACATAEQQEYFRKLRATNPQTLVNYFNSLNMDGWNADNIPQTSGTSKQKEYSLNSHQQFVMDFLSDPSIIAVAKVQQQANAIFGSTDDLEGMYRRSDLYAVFKARSGRGRFDVTQSLFTRHLSKLVGAEGARKSGNQRVDSFPTLDVARAKFRKETGITHDVFMEG